jgi:hypothetical protein
VEPKGILQALAAKLAMLQKKSPKDEVVTLEENPAPDALEFDLAPQKDMATLDIRPDATKKADASWDAELDLGQGLDRGGWEQRGINVPGGQGRLISEKGWSPQKPKGVTPLGDIMDKMLAEDNPNAVGMAEFMENQQAAHPVPGTQKMGQVGDVGIFATQEGFKNDVLKRLLERYVRQMGGAK